MKYNHKYTNYLHIKAINIVFGLREFKKEIGGRRREIQFSHFILIPKLHFFPSSSWQTKRSENNGPMHEV